MSAVPMRSFARANRELLESFGRYMVARGNSAPTVRAYKDAVGRLVDSLGAESVVNVERPKIRELFTKWCEHGLTANSRRLHVCALRKFFLFLRQLELTKHDPMLLISTPKTGTRLPRVLSQAEVESLIVAAQNPLERAVVELLYSLGVRVSELVNLKLENIHWNRNPPHTIRVIAGKGNKDRVTVSGLTPRRPFENCKPGGHHGPGTYSNLPVAMASFFTASGNNGTGAFS